MATCIHRPDPEQGYIEGNMQPLCLGCHQKVHGNEAIMSDLRLVTRLYYAQQEGRKGIANRVRSYSRDMDLPVPMAEKALAESQEYEQKLQRHVAQLLKPMPIYTQWLKPIKGIGPMLAASLISEIADISRFVSVRSLWKYAGMDVQHGKAPKRTRGNKITWNPHLRTCAWKVASQFVRTNPSFGRTLYDGYKEYYVARDGDLSKGHIDNRARRRVAKDLLRCLWVEWRTLENLPITEPQAGTWPMGRDWTG